MAELSAKECQAVIPPYIAATGRDPSQQSCPSEELNWWTCQARRAFLPDSITRARIPVILAVYYSIPPGQGSKLEILLTTECNPHFCLTRKPIQQIYGKKKNWWPYLDRKLEREFYLICFASRRAIPSIKLFYGPTRAPKQILIFIFGSI